MPTEHLTPDRLRELVGRLRSLTAESDSKERGLIVEMAAQGLEKLLAIESVVLPEAAGTLVGHLGALHQYTSHGPWKEALGGLANDSGCLFLNPLGLNGEAKSRHNAEFCAAAHNKLPKLLDIVCGQATDLGLAEIRIKQLQEQLAAVEKALEEAHASHTEYGRRLKRCLKPDALESTALSPIELAVVRQSDYERLRQFVVNVRDGWDCDEDAHRRGTPCRCCEAEKLVGAAS